MKKTALLLVLICLLALWVMFDHVHAPWFLLNEDNGDLGAQFATMHLSQGLGYTKGLFAYMPDHYPDYTAEPGFYLHSPPLMALVLAASGKLYGVTEGAMRGTMIFLSVLLASAFGFILKRGEVGPQKLVVGLALFICNSMFLFFGRNVTSDSLGLLFTLAGVAFCFWETKHARLLVLLSGFLAGASSFYAAVPAMIFLAWTLFDPAVKNRRAVWSCFCLGVGASWVVLLGQGSLAVGLGGMWNDVTSAFMRRAAISEQARQAAPGVFAWLAQILKWMSREYSPILVIGAVAGAATVVRNWSRVTLTDRIFSLFALSGFLYIFILREGSYQHRYFQFFLLPGIAGLTLVALSRGLDFSVRARIPRSAIICALFVGLYLFTQPVLRLRYERDGRYPTSNPIIHPPILAEVTNRVWGMADLHAPVQWSFPEGMSTKDRQTCLFWPDYPNCEKYQVGSR